MDPNGYSEQQLVDCSKSNYGCDNGWYQRAWEYVALASGQDTSASYLYIATHTSCNANKGVVLLKRGVNLCGVEGSTATAMVIA